MKSFVRTTVVLTALNLVMAGPGLTMGALGERPRVTVVETPQSPEMVVEIAPEPAISEPLAPVERPTPPAVGPWPMAGRTGRGKVLVIPTAETKAEDIAAIHEDMYVMSHIFDTTAKRSHRMQELFPDYGRIFGRDTRDTEAIYIQGYGALFLMEVDLPIAAAPKPKPEKPEGTQEHVDPTWQKAREELFSPKAANIGTKSGLTKYGPEQVEELKKELVKAFKHAANIRGLKPDEWIVLTVVGDAQQPSTAINIAGPPIELSRPRRQPLDVESLAPGTGYGAVGGYGGSYGMGGYGYGMGGYGGTGFASATVLTIRAKKADVNAFAKGEMDFDEFQEHVVVLTYPHLFGKATGGQRFEAVTRPISVPAPSAPRR